MLISISATQCMGKTTFLNDFLNQWKMFSTPKESYRDILKKKDLPINKKTCMATQTAILDSMIEVQERVKSRDNIIIDRGPLDALVYTLWAYEKNVGDFTSEYVANYVQRVRQALKKYDIMFFIPMSDQNDIPVEDREMRDTDLIYRAEIDAIFKGLHTARLNGDNTFFDKDDCAPIIEIFGSREVRVNMVKHYLKDNGKIYGAEESSLLDFTGNSFLTEEKIPLQYAAPKLEDFIPTKKN